MYRKPRFLEILHAIREAMSRDADYDVDLFIEMLRSGKIPKHSPERNIRGYKSRALREQETAPPEQKTRPRKRAGGG
jgi:hypothetical protein